jgi:hypothetical protein
MTADGVLVTIAGAQPLPAIVDAAVDRFNGEVVVVVMVCTWQPEPVGSIRGSGFGTLSLEKMYSASDPSNAASLTGAIRRAIRTNR